MRLGRKLITEEEIESKVSNIAGEIDNYYKGKDSIVLVGVLKGSFIFLSDLSRKLTHPHTIDFIAISSYGKSGEKQGEVRMLMDTRENLAGKDVLIVEDIIDSGKTLSYLEKFFSSRGASSVKTVAFINKKGKERTCTSLLYHCFEIENVWVVGYGLDYKEEYRTLPHISELILEK